MGRNILSCLRPRCFQFKSKHKKLEQDGSSEAVEVVETDRLSVVTADSTKRNSERNSDVMDTLKSNKGSL